MTGNRRDGQDKPPRRRLHAVKAPEPERLPPGRERDIAIVRLAYLQVVSMLQSTDPHWATWLHSLEQEALEHALQQAADDE